MQKFVHKFGFNTEDKNLLNLNDIELTSLLGGKGFSLFNMISKGLNVPKGITIDTNFYKKYKKSNEKEEMIRNIVQHVSNIFVDKNLLYSVRSGAPVSMPGMMDTILNVGISRNNIKLFSDLLGEDVAKDCYLRLLKTISTSIICVDDKYIDTKTKECRTKDDEIICIEEIIRDKTEYYLFEIFGDIVDYINSPNFFENQLTLTIYTVLESWNNERAVLYRQNNNIDNNIGTAVNIQQMVLGNLNNKSCSGVLFTKDPNTGEDDIVIEYLVNSQGEDVVSGSHTPMNTDSFKNEFLEIYKELKNKSLMLEKEYNSPMDIEFTVQDGILYFLQCRKMKQTISSSLKTAINNINNGIWTKDYAFNNYIRKKDIANIFSKKIIPLDDTKKPIFKGLPACGGVVKGKICFDANQINKNENQILVSYTTTPNDFKGMKNSLGIITQNGGITSHASVVARSLNKTCVVGCDTIYISEDNNYFENFVNKKIYSKDHELVIDGYLGEVWDSEDVIVEDNNVPSFFYDYIQSCIKNKPFYVYLDDLFIDILDRGNVFDINITLKDIDEDFDNKIKNICKKFNNVSFNLNLVKNNIHHHAIKMFSINKNINKNKIKIAKKIIKKYNGIVVDHDLYHLEDILSY